MELRWSEILEANNYIGVLVQNLLKQGDVQRASAAGRIGRQLKPEVDLWKLCQQNLMAQHGTKTETGFTIEPGSEAAAKYYRDLEEAVHKSISLPIEALPVTVAELQQWANTDGGVDLFIALEPLLNIT
jgi:hypothetical protein